MIVGGDIAGEKETQVISMDSVDEICDNLAPYPYHSDYSFPLVLNGRPVVCGGGAGTAPAFEKCFRYNPTSKMWDSMANLANPRSYGSSLNIGFEEWWLLGGNFIDRNYFPSSTSQIFKDGAFRLGPNLFEPSARGCGVKINSTHVFFGTLMASQ